MKQTVSVSNSKYSDEVDLPQMQIRICPWIFVGNLWDLNEDI